MVKEAALLGSFGIVVSLTYSVLIILKYPTSSGYRSHGMNISNSVSSFCVFKRLTCSRISYSTSMNLSSYFDHA